MPYEQAASTRLMLLWVLLFVLQTGRLYEAHNIAECYFVSIGHKIIVESFLSPGGTS